MQHFKEVRLQVIIGRKLTLPSVLFSMMSLCTLTCALQYLPVLFLRFAASRAEDEENMFLAPSEGKTRHLPCYY